MAAANVSSMYQFWKDFNLSEFQKELDTLASELANRQDESDTSRKRLVEQSRDFKKNTPEEVRRAVASLLKSFQSEVDNLSKRSKAAEASFLTVYKKLIDVPDPSSSLEHGMNQQKRAQKAQDLEIENQKLRETLDEYNREFAEVKNQEVTIKNLREKLKELEDKLEQEAQSKAAEKEKDLQREFIEKERVLQEKQLTLATKLGEAEQKTQTLQKALESAQSELFDYKAKNEERSAAKSDEVEMLVTDLERTNQRNAALEKELEGLRSQLQSASQSLQQAEQMQKAPNLEQAIDILSRSSLELELSAKEKEISQLVDEVQKLQTANNKLRESTTEKTQKLEEQLQAKTAAFIKLEEKIQSQSDYEDLKRELNILKSLEFANGNDEESEEGDEEGQGKSLEMLLLEKNRALQTENTTLKVTKSDLSGADNGIRQAQAFASMIGQEVAAAYSQRQNSSSSSDEQKSQIIQPIIVIPPGHSNLSPNPLFTFGNGGPSNGYGAQFNSPFSGNSNSMYVNRQLLESYHWIDTSRVAKQIKDLLTQLNIGQRLFGELVLGMSQGSVSDILARPKPWDRLTAKGREPYIKMVQFLADPRNVEQLKIMNAQRKGVDVDALSQTTVSTSQSNKSTSDAAINDILAKARQELELQRDKSSGGSKSSSELNNKRKRKKPQANRIIPSLWKSEQLTKAVGNYSVGSRREPLPALTSEDYEQNSDLNTFDIIRRTKEILEQNNIPQEPFGTYVVGMSQGSVSDLLSKTKPWENLTLKGKEPFVRMNMWLNDPDGVRKLKDKMRHDKAAKSVITVLDLPAGEEEVSTSVPQEIPDLPQPPQNNTSSGDNDSMEEGPPELPPVHEQAAMIEYLDTYELTRQVKCVLHENNLGQRAFGEAVLGLTQGSAAMIEYLDTYELTRQVKCVLHENNLGQRAFGEAVLGLTQGSVSDLLSKPKMWLKLSMKGREPYVRMYLWLQDKNSIEKVRNYKPRRKPRHEELKAQYDEAVKTTQGQKSLIVKLEQDLLSVNTLSTLYRGEGEGQAAPSSEAEVIAEAVKETTATLPLESTLPTVTPSNNAAESLLPIVSSQRERFRLRNQELEGENRQQQQQILILRTEVDNLRSDNVKLYEKIKFLQSYPTSKSSLKADDTESRYSRQYEARLDPFNSFSRKEKQRKYMNLSPFDKATLNVGRTILSNKLARLFAFCYFMFLHILVFLVLYKMAHTAACKKDSISDCYNKFQQHMHDFHPGDHLDMLHQDHDPIQ